MRALALALSLAALGCAGPPLAASLEQASAAGTSSSAGATSVVPNAGTTLMGAIESESAVTTHTSHPHRVSLVDHSAWELLDADADPFTDRPSEVTCDPRGVARENLGGEDAFGVDTGTCGYVTAREPIQDYVAEGEALQLRIWHFALTAPEPTEGHVVLQLDGTTLLDERVAIPAQAGLIRRVVQAPRAFAAGAPIVFHIHNHGSNSWALVEVSVGP